MTDLKLFIFVSLVSVSTSAIKDPFSFLTPAVLYAALIGFAMRIGAEWAKNSSSWKNTIIQFIYTTFLLYIGIFIWADYNIGMNIVYYAAMCGAFSVVIVNASLKWIELGLSGMIKHYVLKFLSVKAEDVKDVKQPEEEKP